MRPRNNHSRLLHRLGMLAAVPAIALAGMLAGCDDDSDGDAAGAETTAAEPTGSAAPSASIGESGSAGVGDGDDPAGTADTSGSDGASSSGDLEEFCDSLVRIDELDPNAEGDEVVEEFRRLDESAPDEVADATAQLMDVIELSMSAFELEGDEQQQALEELATAEDEFNRAAAEFETFAIEACPDLDPAIFGTSTTEP